MTASGSFSFMDYDLGYVDLEQKTLQPLEKSFRTESVTYVLGTICLPCLRNGQKYFGGRHGIRTHDPHVANVVLSQLS